MHTHQLIFLGTRHLVGPQVCGRELIAYFLILMEFTTAHLQFVKSTTQLLARTTVNNFKQPLKIEFKKNSHILMGSKYFYPKFLVRLNIILK